MAKESSLTARQQFGVAHLRVCAARGQSLSAYAGDEGLSIGALYEVKTRWRRRGLWPVPGPRFVRVQAASAPTAVPPALLLDPLSAQLFGFTNRRYNRAKVLYWGRNGFVLWQKRLERDRFHWPRGDRPTVCLNAQELNWLLDGFDLRQWRPHACLNYAVVA